MRRHFIDVIDEAIRTGESLGDAILRDVFSGLDPITVRPVKLGGHPCSLCGEREFHCTCPEAA